MKRVQLVGNWKDAFKFWSNKVFVAIAALAGIETYVPEVRGYVPPWAYLLLGAVGVVARNIKQNLDKDNAN